MASLRRLARYIYENQKKGFSDIEISQLLQESGWKDKDIEEAFKKALSIRNADLFISAPISYFRRIWKRLVDAGVNFPRGIKGNIASVIFFAKKILKMPAWIVAIFISATRRIKKVAIFLAVFRLGDMFAKLKRRKKDKISRDKSADELSKYIEKNLKNGVLESDVFVELLKIGWDKRVVDKAFSYVRGKMLKRNFINFIKSLFFSPVIFLKSVFGIFFVAVKFIFFDFPRFVLRGIGASAKYIASVISRAIFDFGAILKNIAKPKHTGVSVGFFEREKRKEQAFVASIQRTFLLSFSRFSIFFKSLFSKKFGKVEHGKEFADIIVAVKKPSVFSRITAFIKYFIGNYPESRRRVQKRIFGSFISRAERLVAGLLNFLARIKDFILYDTRFYFKKIFFIFSRDSMARIGVIFSQVSFVGVIRRVALFFRRAINAVFPLIKKAVVYVAGYFRRMRLESFNLPFEIIEFVVLKIYQGVSAIFRPIARSFILFLKSLRGVMVPASKDLVARVPQSLFEVPIGEVPDVMRVTDVLRISGRMFKTRRMRTFLTVLGIGIGIGAILFLVSLGYGLQRILIEEIATSDALLSLDVTTRDEELIPLSKDTIKGLAESPEVLYVSPLIAVQTQISLGNVTGGAMINGILPNYFKLGGISADYGEVFKEGDTDKIVISLPVVRLLGFGENGDNIPKEHIESIIGQEVSVKLLLAVKTEAGVEEIDEIEFDTNFKISGVIEGVAESVIYFPLSRLENIGITNYQSAKVRVIDDKSIELVRTKAVDMGFLVAALSDTIEQANRVFQVLQIILALFGIVALSVSAIGMFNTMTIALLERTQEIGIMKSLGASNRNVWELFLAESIIMGFLGGLGGIIIGYVSSEGFNLFVRLLAGALGGKKVQLFERPWWFIVTILVFSTAVGFFTGLWPAKRAAKINILQALRYK